MGLDSLLRRGRGATKWQRSAGPRRRSAFSGCRPLSWMANCSGEANIFPTSARYWRYDGRNGGTIGHRIKPNRAPAADCQCRSRCRPPSAAAVQAMNAPTSIESAVKDGKIHPRLARGVSALTHRLFRGLLLGDHVVDPLLRIGLRQSGSGRNKLRQIGFVGRRKIAGPHAMNKYRALSACERRCRRRSRRTIGAEQAVNEIRRRVGRRGARSCRGLGRCTGPRRKLRRTQRPPPCWRCR